MERKKNTTTVSFTWKLLLLAALSLLVVLATAAVFLPVFAQPETADINLNKCPGGDGPYPYPGPSQSDYPEPGYPARCLFLPIMISAGK